MLSTISSVAFVYVVVEVFKNLMKVHLLPHIILFYFKCKIKKIPGLSAANRGGIVKALDLANRSMNLHRV